MYFGHSKKDKKGAHGKMETSGANNGVLELQGLHFLMFPKCLSFLWSIFVMSNFGFNIDSIQTPADIDNWLVSFGTESDN